MPYTTLSSNKPRGKLWFFGPSRTGKTATANVYRRLKRNSLGEASLQADKAHETFLPWSGCLDEFYPNAATLHRQLSGFDLLEVNSLSFLQRQTGQPKHQFVIQFRDITAPWNGVCDINFLRSQRVPFLIAVTKIDKLPGWFNDPEMSESSVKDLIELQPPETQELFNFEIQQIIDFLKTEYSLEAALFYNNEEPGNVIDIVPLSGINGAGVRELTRRLLQTLEKHSMEEPELLKA